MSTKPHILKDGTVHQDLGPCYHDERTHHRTLHRAVQRIGGLGYKVTLEVAA